MTQGQTLALDTRASWPLHDTSQTQALERAAQAQLPAHTLMQRAGLAIARMALAIAPHAQTIWIACGPGNNGGDGLEAAAHLKRWGKYPVVTWHAHPNQTPSDAAQAAKFAHEAGVCLAHDPPIDFDLAIDAVFGIGSTRAPHGQLAQWLYRLHHSTSPVLCVDLPSGLLADSGQWLAEFAPTPNAQRHTLSLLSLKPGLFTAQGRDAAGQVWFNDLGVDRQLAPHIAYLQTHAEDSPPLPHSTHKGSRGDVAVIGGTTGMQGAAILAATAALQGGAGRVYLGLLDQATPLIHPALMMRAPQDLALATASVVCGCGGGTEIAAVLPRVLSTAPRLVLDADALNAIANDGVLHKLLQRRHGKGQITVITPHPLEAARLLGQTVSDVQQHRLHAAQQLVAHTHACVVLKGSGTVIASPHHTPVINHSGNARLACAGTGDVLAGLIGAKLWQTTDAFRAACEAVYAHGRVADAWPPEGPALNAASLAAALR